MILGEDLSSKTARNIVAEKGQIGILHKLWKWAKQVLTQEELKNMF
jgi:hypothetical protein